jgi:hypothetical protein
MALGNIQIVPRAHEDLLRWSFSHAANHLDFNRLIAQKYNQTLPSYILDPFDSENQATLETWFSQHFQMHLNQNAVLGIAGTLDFGVDWATDEHLQTWIFDNWVDHVQACQILGIG